MRRAARRHARTPPREAPIIRPVTTPAATLARDQQRASDARPYDLSRALGTYDRILDRAYQVARRAASDNRRVEPAAEWLTDNVYLIRNEIREVREALPPRTWRALPCCEARQGLAVAVPRMLRVVRAALGRLDGSVEPTAIEHYLAEYQQHAPLKLVELWALPALIRVALIEGLAAGAAAISERLEAYSRAEHWAERLIAIAANPRGNMLVSVAEMAKTDPFASSAFAAEFYRLLEGKHPALKLALSFAEQQLEQRGASVAQAIEEESRVQAADQVALANRINSLRQLTEHNWPELIERVGGVDQVLARDPAGAYARMDFATRGRYRNAVEKLAALSGHDELDVARRALALAERPCASNSDPRTRHVGYYLVGPGRFAFAHALGARTPPDHRLAARLRRWPSLTYLGGIFAGSLVITALIASGHNLFLASAPAPLPLDVALLVALFVAASQPAVTLVNWLLGMLVPPRLLPRMSYAGGIPDDCRTLVVVPWLLGSEPGLENQLAELEIRYLGNRDPNLRFALLTDFPDAPHRDMPGDAALLAAATRGIDRLNAKYPLAHTT
ncbi:MAG TPA: hypothetical protein VFQ95_03515, partial [Rhodanobacteraceae bacterium]|nr:hypothetical protein [Rhodanobacteraceae bacterium]